MSTLARKLNLTLGMTLQVVARPRGVQLENVVARSRANAGILVFAERLSDVDAWTDRAIVAAGDNRLVWFSYPKARQKGTDLNRDILRTRLRHHGIQAVRQIAIDDVWSAIRFRAAETRETVQRPCTR